MSSGDIQDYKLKSCTLCPRACGADREADESCGAGFCGAGRLSVIGRADLHFWEEPPISGSRGSGTVFFSGCALGCVFCQNRAISALATRGEALPGRVLNPSDLAACFLRLQARGAHNINLVTAGHYLLEVRSALLLAKEEGLTIPVVYNSSAYELPQALRLLEGLIDIYLPDFKFMSAELAERYARAPDYPERAKAAIAECFRQVGEAEFDTEGLMKKGLIVRHLMLPGHLADSKAVLDYLFENYENRIYYSLMNQYTPMADADFSHYPELARHVSARAYESLINYACDLGIENAFVQEEGTVSESFIPNFDGTVI